MTTAVLRGLTLGPGSPTVSAASSSRLTRSDFSVRRPSASNASRITLFVDPPASAAARAMGGAPARRSETVRRLLGVTSQPDLHASAPKLQRHAWHVGVDAARTAGGECGCALMRRLLLNEVDGEPTSSVHALMRQCGPHLTGCTLCDDDQSRAMHDAARASYLRYHRPPPGRRRSRRGADEKAATSPLLANAVAYATSAAAQRHVGEPKPPWRAV